MLNILFSFIFKIISKLADIIVSPLILAITTLIPAFSDHYDQIISFYEMSLTYVSFLIDFLMIPRSAIYFLFDYLLVKYSIYTVKTVFNFTIKIYNYFKP